MTWRIAHRGEYGDSEWVQVKGGYQCAIPLFREKSKELANLKEVKRDWKDSFLESAHGYVIKVREGYFVVHRSSGEDSSPTFAKMKDPRPHCSLRRVS